MSMISVLNVTSRPRRPRFRPICWLLILAVSGNINMTSWGAPQKCGVQNCGKKLPPAILNSALLGVHAPWAPRSAGFRSAGFRSARSSERRTTEPRTSERRTTEPRTSERRTTEPRTTEPRTSGRPRCMDAQKCGVQKCWKKITARNSKPRTSGRPCTLGAQKCGVKKCGVQ